jgi:hypothetical protein
VKNHFQAYKESDMLLVGLSIAKSQWPFHGHGFEKNRPLGIAYAEFSLKSM